MLVDTSEAADVLCRSAGRRAVVMVPAQVRKFPTRSQNWQQFESYLRWLLISGRRRGMYYVLSIPIHPAAERGGRRLASLVHESWSGVSIAGVYTGAFPISKRNITD